MGSSVRVPVRREGSVGEGADTVLASGDGQDRASALGNSPESHPTEADREAVARALYDHLCTTREHDSATYPIYLEKTRHLMTVVVVVCGAMSYALTQAGWVFEPGQAVHRWTLCVLGGLGALALFVAFTAGILCNVVHNSSVVGVARLHKQLTDDTAQPLQRIKPHELHRQLSINVCQAILENRQAEHKRTRRSVVLNWSTLIGVILGAIFIAYAIAGDVVTGQSRSKDGEISSMSNHENESRPTDAAKPNNQDPPPFVEPTDTVKSGGEQPEVNAGSSVGQPNSKRVRRSR